MQDWLEYLQQAAKLTDTIDYGRKENEICQENIARKKTYEVISQ